ncbi:type II toxin-antitoxin system RelE/ParE family toxin [Marinobacter gelidimuriae]|uniref:type II toxin-antitoxin system RelE/ParE family toxin n=1 Tax=Marinobacter gelidimuriae TaxID=2739064 RepID=UPI001E62770F|nr:type II toxin-antitoxin system RelE/ParE family toxin [Marinobacter gelidimuriae]
MTLGANYAHVLPGYRRLQVEHHAVFYRVLESEMLIVRVLHEDMDAPERLLD